MELRITNLAVARGRIPLLAGVEFALAAGQALILRGPNGSGKTTLLRTLAGLQPALDGRVEVAAEALAYAGHADGIKSVLTVDENLTFWERIYGTTLRGHAKAKMNLEALSDRPAMHLSAGQKRRLGLARLLVTGRRIWLLDEPTVSLDAASVQLFVGVLRTHLAEGGAALIATHIDLGLAEAQSLDLTDWRAKPAPGVAFDAVFGGDFA